MLRGFVERLLLFLLGRLLGCLLCLLRFLGHVALHHPKSCLNAGRPSTCMHSEYTIILKLIPRASKRVNDGHAVATCGSEIDTALHVDSVEMPTPERSASRPRHSLSTSRREPRFSSADE